MAGDKITELGTTRSGFPPNIAAVLSYVLTVLTGAVMFVIEKENKYVRFHAAQSMLFGATWIILWILAGIETTVPVRIVGFVIIDAILFVVALGGFITWLFLLYKAYRGAKFKLPVLGDIAERIA